MKPRRLVLTVCALLAVVLAAGGPAAAASKAKKPKPPKPHVTGVWVGRLERHGSHWDYVGQGCPIDTQICAASVVHYRINPTTPQARNALKNYAGGSGGVWGTLLPANDKVHQGALNATQIATEATIPPSPGLPGTSGASGDATQGGQGSSSTPAP
ncbi:MAG: hypothetical protein QOJ23_3402 [Actinomycetota bacterium]|nr:hypothetical protein [Actinomycetota bacterium]